MRVATTLVVTACVWGLCGQFAAAQNNRSMQTRMRQMMQNVQRDIQNTEKLLKPAQEELGRAMSSLQSAQSSFKSAQSDVEKARKTLNERVGPKVGLPEANAGVERAQEDYDKAVAALVASLDKDEAFQKLKTARDAAEEKITSLRKDKSASSSSKKAANKEFQQAKEAYIARLDKDPAVKPAKERLAQAEDHLKDVRKRMSQESKDDTELHTAEASFKQAKAALHTAQNVAATAEAKVEALQERLAANYALLGQ